eukprot:s1863_g8.t2
MASPSTVPCFASTAAARRLRRTSAARRRRRRDAQRLVDLLLGDAVGDAFGFGIEMQDAYWIRQRVTKCSEWPQNPAMKEDHKPNNIRGMYSDDCEMTVGLMRALMKAEHLKDLGEPEMLEAWQNEWLLSQHRPAPALPGIGRAGHGSIKAYFEGRSSLEELKKSQAERVDPGNAPPMRALPLAFLELEELERLSAVNANATHPHPKASAASFLMAMAARYLILEKGKQESVIECCLQRLRNSSLSHAETEEYLEVVQRQPDYHSFGRHLSRMPPEVHEALCGPQPNPQLAHCRGGELGNDAVHGVGSDAMRTAGVVLYLLRFHRGPRDVLLSSVHLGGDVDSVAALALATVAAVEGCQWGTPRGLPWKLLEELEGVEYLICCAEDFAAWLESTRATKGMTAGTRPISPNGALRLDR